MAYRATQFSSWAILFAIQVYFNIYPIQDEWLRILILASYMLLVSFAWVMLVERVPLARRLNLNDRTTVVFVYSLTASVLVLFTRRDFMSAALIAGGSMVLPVFEELYFRAYLLGSVSFNWPSVNSMDKESRKLFLREGLVYLTLSSLGFALVHDDVIRMLLSGGPMVVSLTIFLLRFLFGFTIGGLYFYTRNFMVTSVFHIIYNLTYIIAAT